jgi:hypothetical protein
LPDQNCTLRVPERKRAQEQGVDDAEDADRGADSKRKHEHGDDREARTTSQKPQAVTHVVNQLGVARELPA